MTTVAILRTKEKKEESVKLGEELGFTVRYGSPIEMAERDSPDFSRFVEDLEAGRVKKVVVASATSLKFMLSLLHKRDKAGPVVRRLNERGIIAIGPVTAEAAKKEWIKAEELPERFTAEAFAEIIGAGLAPGDLVWVVRSNKGTDVMTKGLQLAGAKVEEVAVYALRRSEPDRALLDIIYWAVRGTIDAYVFTSAMTVEVFIEEGERKYGVKQFGVSLNGSVIAAINEATKKALEGLGIDVDVLSRDGTYESMMYQLNAYFTKEDHR